MTDLLYTDVEEHLRSSVRDLISKRSTSAEALKRAETDEPYDPALWQALAGLGVAGLAIDEPLGGAGASWREVAVVAEELGRSVAPTPFLGSAVVATAAAQAAGDTDLLARMASGEIIVTLAASLAGTPHAAGAAGLALTGTTLTGSVTNVIDAITADVLLVPVRDGDAVSLVAVAAADTHRSDVASLDLTRPVSDLAFDNAPVTIVAEGDAAQRAITNAWLVGSAILASEQLGLAQQCLDMTVDYVKSRYQFGRPIGSFQALKHRLADVWVSVTHARAVARYAVACVTDGDADATVSVSLAQAYCSPMAVTAAEECVQLHGGIGFTWEHPAHLYLKRAKADSLLFGTAATHRARLGGLVGLPPQ
ncbi:MAG TPA: acyl-CoA dehydrogenase family protein [Jatrophihabitantaceae bacterium]|jgi:alkylation response protein AidB-like acyl-CoA dehydrogenase|nr:acyl-CoA dehydrogenase family protein [Jatrophihabitantaceae bacterium]